jgi:hypothetical protein
MRLATLVLLAALGLSGCYASKRPLLDARLALHPIAVGTIQNPDDNGGLLDISDEGGGWYRIYEVGDDEANRIMFTPLPGQERVMAMMWGEKEGYLYGLAVTGDDGLVHMGGVSCETPAAYEAAVAQKARVTQKNSSRTCEFRTRAALIAALGAYAPSWDWKASTMHLPAAGPAPSGPSPRPAPRRQGRGRSQT